MQYLLKYFGLNCIFTCLQKKSIHFLFITAMLVIRFLRKQKVRERYFEMHIGDTESNKHNILNVHTENKCQITCLGRGHVHKEQADPIVLGSVY